MVEHFCLDVEIRSESGRVSMTPAGEGASEHVGRLHRPPTQLGVGEGVELRMVGRHLGPGRVDLSCRIVALYHHDITRDCEVGASFRVAVIRAMQRGRRRRPEDVFGNLEEGRIPEFDGVIGNLAMMSLPDLLQSIANNGQSGLLEVQSTTGMRGGMWITEGRVRHAELSELEGRDAFFGLLGIEHGMFRLRFGVPTPRETVRGSVSQLLLEGLRRYDEQRIQPLEDELEMTDPSLTFDLVISDEGPPVPC
jgi:hypothetical protein